MHCKKFYLKTPRIVSVITFYIAFILNQSSVKLVWLFYYHLLETEHPGHPLKLHEGKTFGTKTGKRKILSIKQSHPMWIFCLSKTTVEQYFNCLLSSQSLFVRRRCKKNKTVNQRRHAHQHQEDCPFFNV